MIQIQALYGTIVHFPAGTDDATIYRVARQASALQTAPPEPQIPGERLQSQQIMNQYQRAEAAGDYDTTNQLLRVSSYAATQDGTAPDSRYLCGPQKSPGSTLPCAGALANSPHNQSVWAAITPAVSIYSIPAELRSYTWSCVPRFRPAMASRTPPHEP